MKSDSPRFNAFRCAAVVVAMVTAAAMAGTTAASASATAPGKLGQGGTSSGKPWLPPTPSQWPVVVDEQNSAPQTVTRGITHSVDSLQTVAGAQKAQVLNVDLTDPNVRLATVESHDHLTDPPNETVTSMARRTGAVAGINGDFFNIYGNGTPEGILIRDGRLLKSPSPSWPADLGVQADGSIVIGTQKYAGTITDGTAAHPLASVNTTDTLSGNGITRVTPELGASSFPASTVVAGHTDSTGSTLTVDSVNTAVTSLPPLSAGTEDLVGHGASGAWLGSTVKPGDTIKVAETISPDNNLSQALSGGAIIVKNGAIAVPLQGGGENNINDPVTGLGVTADGRHAIVAVFDGHAPESVATGLTRPQLAGWMIAHGAANAILFDSGGSSQMDARLPGQALAAPVNVPSDGHERPVANGLFFYSAEAAPGPATTAVVNNGQPMTMLTGSTVSLPAYATDAMGNPAADQPAVVVHPTKRATVMSGTLTAGSEKGGGELAVQAGSASSYVALKVVDKLSSLTISPSEPDLNNGGTQQFTDSAITGDATTVTLPAQSLTWSVSPPDLGTIDTGGLFTAATNGNGLATVTGTYGGVSAQASVAVGQTPKIIDPMTDPARWTPSLYSADGSISASTDTAPGSPSGGSLRMHYAFTQINGVQKVMITPAQPITIGPDASGRNPAAIGVWVKGNPDLATITGGTDGAITPGVPTLGEMYTQPSNQPITFWPSSVTRDGWTLITATMPPGLSYPLTVNQLKLVIINAPRALTGDIELADLQALYSPRPEKTFNYTPIPANPSWLGFVENPAAFSPTGSTMLTGDDAHLVAADPGSAASNVMSSIGATLATLPAQAKPQLVQTLGDMSDDGALPDLLFAQSKIASLGLPYRDLVGNHEITQGALPENGNFNKVFGDTHYAYSMGIGSSSADVIAIDSAHGGITASDPFQTPAGGQWPWLVQQLTATTSQNVVVLTHMPAYDPHPVANSQFNDRYEAQEYVRLIQRYQQSHPAQHVVMMYGHSRGVAEQILAPDGTATTVAAGGVPQFTFGDLGMPAYATSDQGGFYNYGLLHVTDTGNIQFAVQPVLASIAVTTPQPTLPVGATEALTAIGTNVGGDNLATVTMPIADPASHVWSSSDPAVARVDPVSGKVTGAATGTATITVESGGVTASSAVTVISE